MDDQLRARLTKIRDRMGAIGTIGGGPATVESYRAMCEIVWAELDDIVREPSTGIQALTKVADDMERDRSVINRLLFAPPKAPLPEKISDVLDQSGDPIPPWQWWPGSPVTPEEDEAWSQRPQA